jgi:hypothetical protein
MMTGFASAPQVAPTSERAQDEPTRPAVSPPTRWERVAIGFFALFLLIFPKGGIKLAGVPITWGYLGFGPVVLWFAARMSGGAPLAIARTRLLVLALLVPFQLIGWLAFLTQGVEGTGFAISFLVTFFVVPPIFVLIFGAVLDRIELDGLMRWLRAGVLFVAAYGIFLFFFKLGTGHFVEIPFLTVNLGDVGELEGKHIDRGGIFKLISTYNNGNIYGVSILILLPLYCWLEPRWTRRGIVRLSLLLTLSRTVWAGLIVFELLWRIFVERISLRTVVVLSTSLLITAAGVWIALDVMGRDPSAFLLDRSLGGRLSQLQGVGELPLLPREAFSGILEMVYLSVLQVFGLFGLGAFILALSGPLLLFAAGALPWTATSYKRALALGLGIYLLVAMSDGALLFIPVMALYWLVASLLLSGNVPANAV